MQEMQHTMEGSHDTTILPNTAVQQRTVAALANYQWALYNITGRDQYSGVLQQTTIVRRD